MRAEATFGFLRFYSFNLVQPTWCCQRLASSRISEIEVLSRRYIWICIERNAFQNGLHATHRERCGAAIALCHCIDPDYAAYITKLLKGGQ